MSRLAIPVRPDTDVARRRAIPIPRQETSPRGRFVVLWRAVIVVFLLAAWQLMSGRILPSYAVSDPVDIAKNLGGLLSSASGWSDIRTTAAEVALGFGAGVAIGTVGGLICGSLRTVGAIIEPLIAAVNGIPKVALAPLFVLLFGIGQMSKVAIAATMVAFVVFYSLYYGMRTVRRELEQQVLLMGGSRLWVLAYVVLPSLVSPFFAGLKTGAPLAIIGVIIGEFLASFNGIGHLLFVDGNDLDAAGVFSGLVVLVVFALLLHWLLSALDGLVSRKLGLVSAGGRTTTSARNERTAK